MTDKPIVSVRLDPDGAAQLRDLANQHGCTLSDLLRNGAIREIDANRNTMTITWGPITVHGANATFDCGGHIPAVGEDLYAKAEAAAFERYEMWLLGPTIQMTIGELMADVSRAAVDAIADDIWTAGHAAGLADGRQQAAEEIARQIAEFRDGLDPQDWEEERNALDDAHNIALEVGRGA